MKNKIIILTAAVIITAGFLTGCKPSEGGSPFSKAPVSDSVPAAEKSFNVRTVDVVRREISSQLTISGDVEASVSVDVYPNTSGKLSELLVEVGSYVQNKQVIARIDPAKPGMNYAESPVEAPISGTITAINADPGATLGPQMPLFTIGNISRLVITTQIPERFIYMIKTNQTAWITTSASPGVKYEARVSSISPVVNPSSRTLPVELRLIGSTPIKAGMFVGIELITSTSENTLVVPEKAVLSRDEESYVYLAQGSHVKKTTVTTGLQNKGMIEIVSGLTEGDKVVLDGITLLSDGSSVNIINNGDNR